MNSKGQKLARTFALLVVWTLALASVWNCAVHYREYQLLNKEVVSLQSGYQDEFQKHGFTLAEGEKIKHDKQYQIKLLKQRLGYTEPDESPIVVQYQEAQ